jgi:hypothetical protein
MGLFQKILEHTNVGIYVFITHKLTYLGLTLLVN